MKVALVKCDDWEALYIDGQVVTQGHKIEAEEILHHIWLNHPSFEFETRYADDKYVKEVVNQNGEFPEFIKEVKF